VFLRDNADFAFLARSGALTPAVVDALYRVDAALYRVDAALYRVGAAVCYC